MKKPQPYRHSYMDLYVLNKQFFCIETHRMKGALKLGLETAKEIYKWLGKFIEFAESKDDD